MDDKTIEAAKAFFKKRGVETAGGITFTIDESNRFQTFCYSNPEQRAKVKEIVEHAARHFDEIILDDFFFTNCKCPLCIKAKGDQSWTDYRLQLMTEAAKDLVVGPAKTINPKVKVVIKYPNWYEHFQGLGFNLETEPKIFDGIYTGTETRDPSGNQHLQQYLGYLIFRYFENIKPGGNGGGWVDPGGMMYMDRYAEQLWLTLFAKAPQVALFDYRQLQRPIYDRDHASWQDEHPSFDFDAMRQPFKNDNNVMVTPTTIARAAGYTFEKVDQFLGALGNPVGLKSYKPYQSAGEDFLQNFLGMIGIPMDIVPEFPTGANMVLLTETAKFDPDIVTKIKGQLTNGKSVVITSGLLRALQGKCIEDIAEIRYTDRKALVKDFRAGWGEQYEAKQEMLIPQINYLTNDSWEEISALDETNGWPLLLSSAYASGKLYVLTIPENFTDLYNLPKETLTKLKELLTGDLNVLLEAPGKVSLFVYDNNTFIVESFLDEDVDVKVVSGKGYKSIGDLVNHESIAGQVREPLKFGNRTIGEEKKVFDVHLKPHSYKVFRIE